MKLIYLTDTIFSDRDYNRFGVNELKKNDIIFEIWDFSNFINIKSPPNNFFEKQKAELKNYRLIKNYNELEKENFNKKLIIDERTKINIKFSTCWFKQRGALIIQIEQGLMPGYLLRITFYERIKIHFYKLRQQKFFYLIGLLRRFVILISKKKCKFDIKVLGGAASIPNAQILNIESHARDYDIFLKLNKPSCDKAYLLFIDNGMLNHPDYYLNHQKPYCTDTLYYSAINKLFNKIEEETNLKVIISAHPKTRNIDDLKKKFNNRDISIDHTAELVRSSSIVLAHDTSAINFAVLWNKPLLFITTNEINRNNLHGVLSFSSFLKIRPINADNLNVNIEWISESNKAKLNYPKYKHLLIKKNGTEEMQSSDIFAKTIIKHFG